MTKNGTRESSCYTLYWSTVIELTEVVDHFRSGEINEFELFVIMAKHINELSLTDHCAPLSEIEAEKFLKWAERTVEPGVITVIGGVGRVFTDAEIEVVRAWLEKKL